MYRGKTYPTIYLELDDQEEVKASILFWKSKLSLDVDHTAMSIINKIIGYIINIKPYILNLCFILK